MLIYVLGSCDGPSGRELQHDARWSTVQIPFCYLLQKSACIAMYSVSMTIQMAKKVAQGPTLVKRASRATMKWAWKKSFSKFSSRENSSQLHFKHLMVLRALLLVKAEVPEITLL